MGVIASRFHLMFLPTGVITVTTANPVKEKNMSDNAIDSETISKPVPDTTKPKAARKAKKAKSAKKVHKKASGKPKADRANKKAEVIAMMKRAKGATLAEIMKATGWQPHTVRGFVSILGSKGGEKIESSKNAAGERTYKIGKQRRQTPPRPRARGGVPAFRHQVSDVTDPSHHTMLISRPRLPRLPKVFPFGAQARRWSLRLANVVDEA
jgi:hypothetical protein